MFIILIICFVLPGAKSMGTYVNLADKQIAEEIAIGSLIADLGEESLYHDSERHFTFLDDIKTSIENTYFLLDAVTGRLTSKRYLDRESMCLNKHCSNSCQPNGSCVIDLQVLLIPTYTIFQFKVEIQDINDNQPYFGSAYRQEQLAENVPVGHRIPIEPAYDPDFGQNSVQSYRLVGKYVPFELVLDEASLYLKVTQELSRAAVSNYNLSVEACDAGKPIHCARTLIHIDLMDVNDNKPRFERQNYQFKVPENQLNSPTIGFIRTIDNNRDSNSIVKYSLVNNPGGYFHMDESTGELTLNKWLDYEKDKYFSLNIEAKDTGPRSLQAYTNVEIYVQDLNDNKPDISVSFLNEFHRNETNGLVMVYIEENLPPNKFISHVQIKDRDQVSSGNLEWNVYLANKELKLPSILAKDENYLKINKLNSESFTLSSGCKILDREMVSSIDVSIRATDQMSTVFYNFTIVLLDQNDNTPTLDKQSYDLNINENNYVDQLIHKFEASDPDLDQNGMVVYSLEPSVDFLYIEPLTGYLRASKVFDRERKSLYEFYIVVRDNPSNFSLSRSTRAKCRLNIIDLNDNRPFIIYNSKVYTNITLRVDENLDLGTQVVKLKCIDKDSSSHTSFYLKNQLEYVKSDEIISYLPFEINSQGSVVNSKSLDREVQNEYDMVVVCSDGKLNASLNVKILINDLNDNCPRNLYKKDKIKFINMLNVNASETVFSEMYIDDDTGSNGDLAFELIDQKDKIWMNVAKMQDNIYQMNLSVINSSLFTNIGKYSIRVRIRDMGDKYCEIVENFVLLVGNEEFYNQSMLMEKMNMIDFIHIPLISGSSITFIVVLAGLFVSMVIFLLILLILFVCKKNRLSKQKKEIDGLKVRNYRLMEAVRLDTSHRLSLSTDQSSESVSSNTTKETTSPSPSSKSAQQLTIYELSSFQKANVVRVSDYSSGSSDGSVCNEINGTRKNRKVKRDEIRICPEEEEPCLMDAYRTNSYGHYIRSSIV